MGHGQAAQGHRAFRYKSSPASSRSLIGVRALRYYRLPTHSTTCIRIESISLAHFITFVAQQ
jgi:hypothetical protein